MKSTTQSFTFPVVEVRSIKDPVRESIKTIYALIKVKDLPPGLPTDPNPRDQISKSKVTEYIRKELVDDDVERRFHLLNRGITISAHDTSFNSDKKLLTLFFKTGDESYGIVDGGHTYKIILANLNEIDTDQFVRLEILTGIEEFIWDIARARNTSMQVQEKSLANLAGKFDWIKNRVEKSFNNSHDLISYRENEPGAVDIRDVIGLLTLFNTKLPNANQPTVAYTSKSKCVDLYLDNLPTYKRLAPILPDILQLYDRIQLRAPEIWNGGKTGKEEENEVDDSKAGKYGRIRGVKKLKKSEKFLPFINENTKYVTPDGWTYPIMAALRHLLDDSNGTVSWKSSPSDFFDKHGRKLLEITKETNDKLGGNPNAVGKSSNHWDQLLDKVKVLHAGL